MLEATIMRLDPDPSSFFDEFHPRVFRFIAGATGASAADVDDLVQETLLHAWKNRAQFRGDASPLTWVLSIARNRIRMRNRSLGRKAELEAALRAVEREEIPDALLRSAELARAVRRALDALDPATAALLLRRYFDGRSVRQIAEQLGESEKAVESRLHRAREALRGKLVQGGHDER
jgi:RNA polymerase sigma-70 factor (ECF subfamily)